MNKLDQATQDIRIKRGLDEQVTEAPAEEPVAEEPAAEPSVADVAGGNNAG
jgi:hypothetical protein